MNKFTIMILTLILLITPIIYAGISFEEEYGHKPITLIYFYKQGCPACAKMSEFLEEINSTYKGGINIQKYETHQNGSLELAQNLSAKHNFEVRSVPLVFINDSYYTGFNDNTKKQLIKEIEYCAKNECISPYDLNQQPQSKLTTYLKIIVTLMLVIVAIIITKKKK